MSVLDDLKLIHQKDPDDTLGIAERQGQQLTHHFEVNFRAKRIDNIVYCGMGGSALAALASVSWPGYKIPFEVVREYKIPAYVSENTLVILCSYSGNTEETLSCLKYAESQNAQICIIAGGGQLGESAEKQSYPYLCLPKVDQPRYAVLYNLKALVDILIAAGQIDDPNLIRAQQTEASKFLSLSANKWQATRPTDNNLAKQIALEASGKSVVIYAGPLMAPAAYKWKIGFNENAKQVAWWNQYPEFNHNEFIGWSEQPTVKPYLVIDLRSNLEHPRIQKRFELSSRLLSGKRPDPLVVNIEGQNVLEQVLYASMLGDFVSIYSGIVNGVNPGPVALVEKLKKEMG